MPLTLTRAPELDAGDAPRWRNAHTLAGARGVAGFVNIGARVSFHRHGQTDQRELDPWHRDAAPVLTVYADAYGHEPGTGTLELNRITYGGTVYGDYTVSMSGEIGDPQHRSYGGVSLHRVGDYGEPTDAAYRIAWELPAATVATLSPADVRELIRAAVDSAAASALEEAAAARARADVAAAFRDGLEW